MQNRNNYNQQNGYNNYNQQNNYNSYDQQNNYNGYNQQNSYNSYNQQNNYNGYNQQNGYNSYNQQNNYNYYNQQNGYNGYNQQNSYNTGYETDTSSLSRFITNTFMWMFVGLAITFGLSFYLTQGMDLVSLIRGNSQLIILASVAEIVFILILSFAIKKLSVTAARVLYLLYSVSMGVVISPILVMYSLDSVIWAFGVSAGMFGILAFLGYTTRLDLSRLGVLLSVGLVCVLLYSLISLIFGGANIIVSALVIVIFLGFTAYDMQMIKRTYQNHYMDTEGIQKFAIISALNLYLDFINIFLRILYLFGRRD